MLYYICVLNFYFFKRLSEYLKFELILWREEGGEKCFRKGKNIYFGKIRKKEKESFGIGIEKRSLLLCWRVKWRVF